MAYEPISAWASQLSLDSLMQNNFSVVLPLFGLVISIALYSIFIWHFYRFIARRDCFKISNGNHPRLISFSKYFLIYPFVAFLFFTGFSIVLMFLTNSSDLGVVLSTSFAVIMAIRITAYYSRDLAKDVAKMLPFALLALVLIDPSMFAIEDMVAKFNSLPEFFTVAVQFIVFIVLAEWIMRILLAIKYMFFPKQEFEENKPATSMLSEEKGAIKT